MDYKTEFGEAGLKITPQRRTVYEIMQNLGHASIEDVIRHAKRRSPDITVSTIYRILNSFCKAGLLSRMNHPDGKCYYDINPVDHHHIYIDNKQIIDYLDQELTELVKQELKGRISEKLNIDKISIQIFTTIKNG